jgi:hypothetical protein
MTVGEVRRFEHPSGVDQVEIRYRRRDRPHPLRHAVAEARAIAERADLQHRDDKPGATSWTRRR